MKKTCTLKFAAFIICLVLSLNLSAQMQIEAEDVIVNREATNLEELLPNKWCIWSTDINKKTWSNDVVVRSPITREDHKTHDEGAPILHIRIPLPEAGVYTIEMCGATRQLGVSLDNGKSWRCFTQGILAAKQEVTNGFFDCWFDDCFKPLPPNSQGPAYIDYFKVTRHAGIQNGLCNPDFEIGQPGKLPPGWNWFHRNHQGSARIVADAQQGRQAVHIQVPGGRDWELDNGFMIPVKTGEEFQYKCHVKGRLAHNVRMVIFGYKDGTRLGAIGNSRVFTVSPDKWQPIRGFLQVEGDVDMVNLKIYGNGEADFLVDNLFFEHGKSVAAQPRPQVRGHAKQRIVENFGRGVVAQQTDDQSVYISWRLLKQDAPDVTFDVYRKVNNQETKLNPAPIRQTCDFVDKAPVEGASYIVRASSGLSGSANVWRRQDGISAPYQVFKLSNPEAKIQKVAIADLNGDGEYDYVVKHPANNIDPWNVVWYKSPDTYKLEAFLSDGTRLWTYDMGWDIERGIWYSPYCAYDLDGDGKAEVITKTSEGDHREADGHVYTGDESFVVLDGMTGKEIARAPWVIRSHFGQEGQDAYHFAARNLMCIALLDGKTPCICICRGTYNDMAVETWQLVNKKLERVWTYDNMELSRKWYGQGAHTTYALDVDGDGRDEIVLGSAVIDDNGAPLWSTGKGHPDGVFFGKLIPDQPGLQAGYIMETPQKKGGLCIVDGKTGKPFWELQETTHHVDGKGQVADIDPLYPGAEIAGGDMHILEPGTNNRGLIKGWLMTADGKELENTATPTYRYGAWTIYWDADLQKEILRGRILDHDGGMVSRENYGSGMVLVADVLGDWREEIISSPAKGEFRIYSTDIPAMDRRPCLMQEHNYRMRMAANAMGYNTEALPPYDLESESPNLNLTCQFKDTCSRIQIVIVASRHTPLNGQFKLIPVPGLVFAQPQDNISLKPGERLVQYVEVKAENGFNNLVKAELSLDNGTVLRGQVLVRIPKLFITNGCFTEAEDFISEQGGEIHIRDDKPNTHGKSLSHWDNEGHALTWNVNVQEDGEYKFVARYCNPDGSVRRLIVDGKDYGLFSFYGTGGFGDDPSEWDHFHPIRNGAQTLFNLKRGKHTVTMENTDGKGTNLDYIVFVK